MIAVILFEKSFIFNVDNQLQYKRNLKNERSSYKFNNNFFVNVFNTMFYKYYIIKNKH